MERWYMANKTSRVARVGWLVMAVAPPSVVLSESRTWARTHFSISILAIFGYEGLLLGVGLAERVWGDLERRWAKRLANHLDLILMRRFSSFSRRYRDRLNSSSRFIDLKGLATPGEYTPQFDEVFVDVSLTSRAPHQVTSNPIGDIPPHVAGRRSL
jgi:hypothetical protein